MFTVYVHFILVAHNHHSYWTMNGRKLPSLPCKERDTEALPSCHLTRMFESTQPIDYTRHRTYLLPLLKDLLNFGSRTTA